MLACAHGIIVEQFRELKTGDPRKRERRMAFGLNNHLNEEKLKMSRPRNSVVFFLLFFMVPFSLYLVTMAPGITEGDSAELVGTAHHLGVAHLGYPLFAMLGKYAAFCLPVGSIAFRVNILCAMLMSGTTLVLAWFLYNLFGVRLPWLLVILFIPVLGPMWQQGVATEVYALQVFLNCLWLYVLFMEPDRIGRVRRLAALFFLFGLALGSHHYTILWICIHLLHRLGSPGERTAAERWGGLAVWSPALLAFMTGIAHFLYIPVRAARGVSWNWNYADNMSNLFDLLSAQSFRETYMYSLTGADLFSRLIDYGILFYEQCGLLLLLAGLSGFIHIFRHQRSLFLVCSGFFIVDVLYCLFLNEAPLDITPFGLMSKINIVLLAVLGINHIRCLSYPASKRLIPAVVFCLVVVIWAAFVYEGLAFENAADDRIASDFIFNVSATMQGKAVLVCEKDEIFPLMYGHTVERAFPGVVLLHYLNFPKPNQWYSDYLADLYPGFTYFRAQSIPSRQAVSGAIENIVLMAQTVKIPVWLTSPANVPDELAVRQHQSGILYRLMKSGEVTSPEVNPFSRYRLKSLNGERTPLSHKYVLAYHELGKYHLLQNHLDLTREYWLKAIEIDSDYYPVLNNLAFLALQRGAMDEARTYFEKCDKLFPGQHDIRRRLEELRGKSLDR